MLYNFLVEGCASAKIKEEVACTILPILHYIALHFGVWAGFWGAKITLILLGRIEVMQRDKKVSYLENNLTPRKSQ